MFPKSKAPLPPTPPVGLEVAIALTVYPEAVTPSVKSVQLLKSEPLNKLVCADTETARATDTIVKIFFMRFYF